MARQKRADQQANDTRAGSFWDTVLPKSDLPMDLGQKTAMDSMLCGLRLYQSWLDNADHVMGEALGITRQTLNGKAVDTDRLLDAMISAQTDYLDCVAETLDSSAIPGLQALGTLSGFVRDAVKAGSTPALQLFGTLFETAGEFVRFTHHQNRSMRKAFMEITAFAAPAPSMPREAGREAPASRPAPPDARAASAEKAAEPAAQAA